MRGYFGQTVTLVAQFGPGQTGLATVGYRIVNGDGTTYQARALMAEAPAGSGTYKVRLAANVFSAAFDGSVDYDNGLAGSLLRTVSEDLQMVAPPLAATGYTAPDNADIALIKTKTDLIPAAGPPDAAAYTNTRAAKLDNADVATSTRFAASSYVGPDNASVAAIKAKTDNLPPDPADASDIAAAFATLNAAVAAVGTPAQAAALTALQMDVTTILHRTPSIRGAND